MPNRKLTGRQGSVRLWASETVGRRTLTTVVLVVAIGALSSACSNNGLTAPSKNSPTPRTSSSSAANLKITLKTVSDAGPDAFGHWQYKGTVRLVESSGVDVTVTNIQVEALVSSNILATAGTNP